MKVLETLFSSRPRVQVIRSFIFQPSAKLAARDIAERTGVARSTARTHAQDLAAIDFLLETTVETENGQSKTAWKLNKSSTLRGPLHDLMLLHQDFNIDDVADTLSGVGDISLAVLTGIFVGADSRPVDLLLVGDNVSENKLEKSLAEIEEALGAELRFAHMTVEEFRYRQNVYDRLIRDVLEYPHRVVIDKVNFAGSSENSE